MFAIQSLPTGLFYAGEEYDNGVYGSGDRFHRFKHNLIHIFDTADQAQKVMEEVQNDPTYLLSVPLHYSKDDINNNLNVVVLDIKVF
jgi:Zn/Cd-binding protein ZinT